MTTRDPLRALGSNEDALDALHVRRSECRRRHRVALGAPGVLPRPWTSSSWTKPARCRWPTSSPSPTLRRASCCSAIRSSSNSRRRGAILTAWTRRRFSTSWASDQTIPSDRGIFLPVTWRLAPSICAFTSELFYESRLTSKPGLERQRLTGAGEFDGSGLWVVDVDHDGNRNSSTEEVEVVAISCRDAHRARRSAGSTRRARAAQMTGRGHSGRRAVQRARQPAGGTAGSHWRPRRHGGQVPGPGSAGRHLLHGYVAARGRTARHGVSVQPQSLERRDVARQVRRHPRREPAALRAGVPHAAADEVGQRAVPLSRIGAVWHPLMECELFTESRRSGS